MNTDELVKYFSEYPDANIDTIEMQEANSIISIYEGEFMIKNSLGEAKLVGKIVFEWLPDKGAYFYGTLHGKLDLSGKNNDYSVIVDGLEIGKGFIVKIGGGEIKGTFSQHVVMGDKSIAVEKIRFSVPNFREILGLPVKRITEQRVSSENGRLILEDETYVLTIDKCSDYKIRRDSLDEKGGYIILYNGELTSKKGAITYSDSIDLFHCLNTFLTFLNGRRTSAFFPQGVYENQTIWSDYTSFFVDSNKKVQSWTKRYSIQGIDDIWKKFRLLWTDIDDKNFLTSIIHWYVEANSLSAFSDGSIILAQTGLELVYNWWIVENKKMILGKDSENISASNKIRLLLSQLNVCSSVPNTLTELINFVTTEKLTDAPEAIVYIRNAIVHSQEDKRKKLSAIHYKAKYEALSVYIWYIELTLLCILGYNEKYFNRCSGAIYAVKAEEIVPWAKDKLENSRV